MANVSQNLRNRLHTNIQNYTRSRLKDGKANSANFVKTINDIINVIHRGKVPGPRPIPPNLPPRPRAPNLPPRPRAPNLPPKPRRNNNRKRTQAGWNALPGSNSMKNNNRNRRSNSMKNNTFHNAQSNQPWMSNMAEIRGRALMNNMRANARTSK